MLCVPFPSNIHRSYRMCKYVSSFAEIGQFQKIVGGLIELVDELAKEAETEKMKVRLALANFEIPGRCYLSYSVQYVLLIDFEIINDQPIYFSSRLLEPETC